VHTLNSLWQHTLARLPDSFPWFDKDKGIKYSNALFALNANQFHGNRGCLPVELHKPTHNFLTMILRLVRPLKENMPVSLIAMVIVLKMENGSN
jgi:hypothetical protein